MLSVRDVSRSFGGFQALRGVNLEAPDGAITGLVGPNGSGKSTLLDVVSGVLRPDAGEVRIDGQRVPLGRPERVAACGLGRSFQVPRLARRLTVLQNMVVAARLHPGERLRALLFRPGQVAVAEAARLRRAEAILVRLALEGRADDLAGVLSGGQQKLLSLGMLLMADPRVLLLDEPAAGVNPTLIAQEVAFLQSLRAEGRTILLVEHNMEVIGRVSDQVYVLDAGAVIARGTPAEIRADSRVVRSYLGQVS